MKRNDVADAISVVSKIAVIALIIIGMNIMIADIANTWHDTRIICQHVTHSQKECR